MTKDYSKAKIYTVRNRNDDSLIYVGSTIQHYLCQRFALHKNHCKMGKTYSLLHQKMRETDLEDWYIELYEAFPCTSKDELLKKEGEVIREIGTLNRYVAGRTKKDYYQDNKEAVIDRMKNYYKLNRIARLAYQNDYNHKAKLSVTDGGFECEGVLS